MSAASPLFAVKSKLNYIAPATGPGAVEKKVIHESEQKLLRLNLTIAELQDGLSSLKIQQNALRRQLEDYRAAISPIRKLLPEILQTIFIQCLPSTCNAVMNSREVPLLLGRICHHWRQIAYATPQLWSSIHIVIPAGTSPWGRQSQSPSLEHISAWLCRSGALPLSISIHFSHNSLLPTTPSTNRDITQPYLDTLAKFKSRWRSLHLSLPSCDWTAALGQFNATDLPLLERLYISGPMHFLPDSSGTYFLQDLRPLAKDSGILQAPRLRSLGVPFYTSEVPQLPIRWENLTSLAILGDTQTFEISAVSWTLSLCPNLTTCTLCVLGATWPSEEGPNITQINLPNLQSISFIKSDTIGPTSHLLKYLHTPQLRHLSFEQDYDWMRLSPEDHFPSAFLDILSAFLGRLVVPLEELDLVVDNVRDMDVVGILGLLPELRRLSLRPLARTLPDGTSAQVYCFRDGHLLSLTPSRPWNGEEGGNDGNYNDSENITQGLGDAPSTCACPNLEVFNCGGANLSDAVLLKFLRSRCGTSGTERNNGFARLRKASIVVNLPWGGRESEDTRNKIRQLQAADPLMSLDVTFAPWVGPPPLIKKWKTFSPYDGLESFRRGW